MIRIFGYSDDNVCVEERQAGDVPGFEDEIGCYDSRVTLIVGGEWTKVTRPDGRRGKTRGTGVRVSGRHGKCGWTFAVSLLGDETGPGIFPVTIEREGYTPVVVIDAPRGVRLRVKTKGKPWRDLRAGS